MKKLRYYPELNQVTGGINATLLMLQLEYWFEKSGGNAFFKFLEPCEDMNYREGDSWVEELGFSKGEFRTAFGKIGKVYKSKKEFNESKDKFEGKLYLSYFDRIKRLTFYMRNTAVVEECMACFGREESETSRSDEVALPLSLECPIDYSKNIETDTCHEEIVACYHEICEELPEVKSISGRLRTRMDKIWQWVKGDMELIRQMFTKVRESDFLSGRLDGKSWRASLEWLMQQEKFQDVLRDKYADRVKKVREKIKANRFTKIASHNWDFDQLEALEQQYIEEQAKKYQGLESPLLSKLMGFSEAGK